MQRLSLLLAMVWLAGCTSAPSPCDGNCGDAQDTAPADTADSGGPAPGSLGARCMHDTDCTSGICLSIGRCAATCTGAASCPMSSNWMCVGVPGRGTICNCVPTSAQEIGCNGIDDDCDGRIDDHDGHCNGVCVDLGSDNANCGVCGIGCAGGSVCSNGSCQCPPSRATVCGTTCVDAATDPANCGGCGRTCASGMVCNGGACATGCTAPYVQCGNACVNTQVDPANCGFCGHSCGSAGVCNAGSCATTGCTSPQVLCGTSCVDTRSDPMNCGACGHACPSGTSCNTGACVAGGCAAPQIICGALCIDPRTDPSNCGSCGHACPTGSACSGGTCTTSGCSSPQIMCGGTCVDPRYDVSNCGGCFHACGSGQFCSGGVCMSSGSTPSPGTPCFSTADCGSAPSARCVTPSSLWISGYCVYDNCLSNTDCGPTGECVNVGTENICYQSCPVPYGFGSCRAGYYCSPLNGVSTGVCLPLCGNDPRLACSGNQCNASTGDCISCTTAADCVGGYASNTCDTSDPTFGVCVCTDSGACGSYVCNTTTGYCN